jgi:hypothetical protein
MELTSILVVVHKIEEDNTLHENIAKNRSNGNTDIVLLVAVMADVGLESQHLEDHVEDANYDCSAKEVDVSIEENLFDHLEFASVAATRGRDAWLSQSREMPRKEEGFTIRSIPCSLLGSLVDAGHDTKFPVREVVEVDVKWKAGNSLVQSGHVCLELPEGVDEENGVIPSVLTRSISCTTCFQSDELTSSRMNRWEVHDSRVRDERDGEVWMVMRSDDWTSWDFLLRLESISINSLPNAIALTSSFSSVAAKRFFVFLIFFWAMYWVNGCMKWNALLGS